MATIEYKCDVCKRSIELLEQADGLTVFAGCVITDKCRGSLHKVKRNPNNIRETLPQYHKTLDDYSQRKMFYEHIQTQPQNKWRVEHGMSSSSVFIVYDTENQKIDPDDYTVTNDESGVSLLSFPAQISGIVHVLSRNGGVELVDVAISSADILVSYNDIITFAVPKYITRLDSGATLPQSQSTLITPTPTPTAIVPQPLSPCDNTVRIDIEIIKPNHEPIYCVETLNGDFSTDSPWYGWSEIVVKNRKQYCLKYLKISKMKVFSNVNSDKIEIPDGTRLKITKIDYGTGVLTNIPDKGLLVLLAKSPYNTSDKILNKIVDCGELVGSQLDYFTFNEMQLYADSDMLETVYPEIRKK